MTELSVSALLRTVAVLMVVVLGLSACGIDPGDVGFTAVEGSNRGIRATADTDSVALPDPSQADGQGQDGVPGGFSALPAVGPAPGSSHWHAAYVVRVCDDVLVPFESDADPLGIHSHADGLIHIHPFFPESGFEASTLGLFADAMGLGLAEGELTLPGGGTWRDGDLCGDQPGRVFVDKWSAPDPVGDVERTYEDPAGIRFQADGELYQIAFAPADSLPVLPPSWSRLGEVSNLVMNLPEPWVRVDAEAASDTVFMWLVDDVTAGPCGPGQVPESVLTNDAACFEPGGDLFTRDEAIADARPVSFNRQSGVELTITPAFRSFIVDQFGPGSPAIEQGIVIAVEVDGAVVTAPLLRRPSASEDRLILAGGMSDESAEALAAILAG